MDKITASAQIGTLRLLLEADGWGAHYLEALDIAHDSLQESDGSGS